MRTLPWKLLLLLSVLSGLLYPFILSAPGDWTISPGFSFYATANGGPIQFATSSTAQGWYWSNSLIVFQNLQVGSGSTWALLGFGCDQRLYINNTSIDLVRVTVIAPGLTQSTTRIFVGSKGAPTTVRGADSWNYDAPSRTITLRIFHESAATFVVEWETLAMPASLPLGNLINQYLGMGDASGFVISTYTYSMGDTFFGIVLLALTIPLYIRTQSVSFVGILWVLVGGMMNILLPAGGISLGNVLLVVGFSALIYRLFLRRE